MDNKQRKLVEDTWELVKPHADYAARMFYGRLFEMNPSLGLLFPEDLAEQRQKLMATISVAVQGLDRMDELLPVVRELGARHVGYGVTDTDYDLVRIALLWSISQSLDDAFTEEAEAAWVALYDMLAGAMKDAAAKALEVAS